MKELESSFDDSTSAMEKNRKKSELLEKQIANQEKQVEELEKGLKAAAEVYGENSAEANKWKQAVANGKSELNKMKKALDNIPKPMQQIGKAMQDTGKKISSFGESFTKKISAPVAALGGLSIAAFNEVDEGLDIVTVKTGATGEALASLQGSVKTLATQIPTDFATAGEAIGEVNTRFGLTGTELETLSGKFVKFAELNGTDVSSSVDKVQKVMAAFGVETKDAGKILDVMNRTGQNTGISMDALETSMIKNAAALQSMGLDAYEAAGFLGSLETSGANTETVMAGMSKALQNAAKDGKTLPQALAEFQSVMSSSASEQEKLNAAMELFGNKAGPAIYEACKQGSLSFESLATDASDYLGSVETTFENTLDAPDKMKVALNNLKVTGEELGGTLLDIATPAIEAVGEAASKAGELFDGLTEDQKEMVGYLVSALAVGGPAIVAVGNLVTAAGKVVEAFGAIPGAIAKVSGIALPVGVAIGAFTLLKAGIDAAHDEAIDSVEGLREMMTNTSGAVKDLNSATADLKTVISKTSENIKSINASAETASNLVEELYSLDDITKKTTSQQARMKAIVAELNEVYPGLSLAIDDTTGSLSKGKEEVKDYVAEAKKIALLEAYTTGAKTAYAKLADAEKTLYEAQKQQNEGLDVLTTAYHAYYEALEAAPTDVQTGQKLYTDEVQRAEEAYYAARNAQMSLNTEVRNAKKAIAEANSECDYYVQMQEELGKATTNSAKATGKAINDVKTKTGEYVTTTKQAGIAIEANFAKGYSTLPYTALQASNQAKTNTETTINGMRLTPNVTQIGVPYAVTSEAKQKVTDGVSHIVGKLERVDGATTAAKTACAKASESATINATVKVGDISAVAWDVKTRLQNWFSSNPIVAAVKAAASVARNAEGGIIQKETLSWLAEGDKPEVVIPLAASQRSNALDLYEQTGRMLGVQKASATAPVMTLPNSAASGASSASVPFNTEQMYAAVAAAAKKGMESANIRIYWDNREAGRIMRNMGVQFV